MKCISIDLDGTLLNSRQEISETNMNVLRELKERGHEVILNTGRAYADVIKIEAIKNINIPIFCLNGSVLYSKTGDILYETTISNTTYKEIFSILEKLGVRILVYTNYGGFPSTLPPLHSKSEEELNQLFNEYNYDDIQIIDNLKIYKLIAFVQNEHLENIELVKKKLANKFPIFMASSFPNNVEIISNEAHKGKALLRYQKEMDMEFEEIIAIGDGGNDLAQFEVASTSIAMENAPLNVKQKADLLTKTNDEDGFAYAMSHLLKLTSTVGVKCSV